MIAAIEAFFGTKLGRWLVVVSLVVAALFAGGVYERDIGYREGLDVGTKQLQAQAKANADAVIALNAKYRKQEDDQRNEMVQQGINYAKSLQEVEDQRDADVAAARSGAIRLSIPAHCRSADDGKPPEATASAPVGNGSERTELPPEVTSDLLALADDADAVVKQLTACQTVIQSYLKGTL